MLLFSQFPRQISCICSEHLERLAADIALILSEGNRTKSQHVINVFRMLLPNLEY